MVKLLLFVILISNAVLANTSTPRDTFRTYLKAMVKVKNNQGDLNSHYKTALTTIELSSFDSETRMSSGKFVAEQLINTLDRLEKVDYNKIPKNYDGDYWIYKRNKLSVDGVDKQVEISLQKNKDNQWKFSQQTVDTVALFYKSVAKKDIVKGVTKLTTFRSKIKSKMPEWTGNKFFIFLNGQWLAIFIILFIGFIFKHITQFLTNRFIESQFKKHDLLLDRGPQRFSRPLGNFVFGLIYLLTINYLELTDAHLAILKRFGYVVLAVITVAIGHRLVDVFALYFAKRAHLTESKSDDILVPLLEKTAYVIVYTLGAVVILHAFTVNVSNLVAGLGIGGLAFAFAAKDSLANFFGSIMLVLDRPFDVGDVIQAGEISGTVMEVGFRSTTVRTFFDSIVTVSNGQLVNMVIDNKGKRRYRRYDIVFGLQYDTPAEKIEEFCTGVRRIIVGHKHTRQDSFHVYFTGFNDSSLDIKATLYWETMDYNRELSERHRFLIDVLRLGSNIGVEFAFPTRTVHLYNETHEQASPVPENYFEEGVVRAEDVLKRPITQKNPSSSVNEFQNNDVGL